MVHDAGSPEVNGVYKMLKGDDKFDGVGMYTHTAKWKGEDRLFRLFRSSDAGAKQWNISIVPPDKVPGTDECISFHWANGNSDTCPTNAWMASM